MPKSFSKDMNRGGHAISIRWAGTAQLIVKSKRRCDTDATILGMARPHLDLRVSPDHHDPLIPYDLELPVCMVNKNF